MDYTQFSKILSIPLPTTPNNSYSVVLDGSTFDIEFRAMGERMLVYISIGDETLVNGCAIKFGIPLNITSQHKSSLGYFWFEGDVAPIFENFSQIRFYFGSFQKNT